MEQPDEYDLFVDDWSDRLENAVISLFKAFLKDGPYKDKPNKLKIEVINILKEL